MARNRASYVCSVVIILINATHNTTSNTNNNTNALQVNTDQITQCCKMFAVSTPQPFTVKVPEEELEYLKQRLASARLPPEQLENIAPWEDGTGAFCAPTPAALKMHSLLWAVKQVL